MSEPRPTVGSQDIEPGEPSSPEGGQASEVRGSSERRTSRADAASADHSRPPLSGSVSAWLGDNRLGLAATALVVGAGAGLGAVGFRWLIFAFTWLVTGHDQFGQQGHASSAHLMWLGIFFVLVVPVVGGLIYGPLVARFAPEARGHGVPEVMLAVTENGGRIRPQVTVVKALASAICISVGGSVGREGPIAQIGSALGSTVGQIARMPESRLRIIVACGAAGGISATFNAPITGLFFGFEIILREFSLDALCATALAAVTGDLVSRAFFGSAPFFSQIPHDLVVPNDGSYLLVAVLAVLAGLIGVAFKTFLYGLEDRVDAVVEGSPGMGAPSRRRRGAGPRAARVARDVRRRLPGNGPRDQRPRRTRTDHPLHARQDPRVQPDALDRRVRRRVRALTVHRRDGGDGLRHHRATPVRVRRRAASDVRARRDGLASSRARPKHR